MAYDEGLAQRVRELLPEREGLSEKKMFGGLCFLDRGNMCFGVEKDRLMVRVGPKAYEEALRLPGAALMDFTGKPMKGLLYVDQAALGEDAEVLAWLRRGLAFTASLPKK